MLRAGDALRLLKGRAPQETAAVNQGAVMSAQRGAQTNWEKPLGPAALCAKKNI